MNIHELENRATPTPYDITPVYNDDGVLLLWNIGNAALDRRACSIFSTPDDDGCIDELVISEEDKANAGLIRHKCNNFLRALAALKEEHNEVVCLDEMHGGVHFPKECPTCNLIKELETVK